MKIRLNFGLISKKEISWWKPITELPNLIKYKDKKWEFVMYDEDPYKSVDYDCIFGEIQSFDPNWYATTYVDFEDVAADTYGDKCDCGAIYTSFSWDHMRMCKKWKPWDQI